MIEALDQSQIQSIIRSKYAFLTPLQFDKFTQDCRQRGLNPWLRHVCPKPVRNDRTGDIEIEMFVTIDGFRSMAARTGEYGSQAGPLWCGEDGIWRDVWLSKEFPAAAKVGIFRKGIAEPFWGIARWDESAQWTTGNRGVRIYDSFWLRMPSHMLAKVAEANGLRRAFPETLAGLYMQGEKRTPGPRTMRLVSDDPQEPVLVLDEV